LRATVDPLVAPAIGSVHRTLSAQHVALTFDDGPDPDVTGALLDLLADRGATATFFLLVDQARTHAGLARRIAAAGHEVALHGADHRRLTEMSFRTAVQYVEQARGELERIVGERVRFYRPPYGAQSLKSYVAVRRCGLEVITWSADAADWVDRPASAVASDALAKLSPGTILLLHERLEPDPLRGAPETSFDRIDVTRRILVGLEERGLATGTVGGLLDRDGARRTAWFRP
jgi:peptidoglycan/xylan/chitin deacetylase (PgdA/CDA1 family)